MALAPPRGLEVFAIYPDYALATWTWRRGYGSSYPTGFQWRIAPSGAWTAVGWTTSARIDGLTAGTDYTVEVRAQGAVGYSPADSADFRTADEPPAALLPPGAPTLDALTPGVGRLTARWTPPAAGGPAARYEIRLGAGAWAPAGSGTTWTVEGLAAGVEVSAAVRAAGPGGAGPASNTLAASPLAAAVLPPGPGRPWGRGVAGGVHWQAGAPAGAAGAAWNWELWDGSSPPARTAHGQAAAGPLAVTTDAPGGTGPWRLRAALRTAAGAGPWSAWSLPRSATAATAPGASGAPAAAAGRGLISLTAAPPADDGNADVTGFDYQLRAGGAELAATAGGSAGAGGPVSRTIRGLDDGTAYEVRVRWRNVVGAGGWSPWSAAATPAVQPPAAPAQPALSPAGEDALSAEWGPPAADGGAPVTGYELQLEIGGVRGVWTAAGASTARRIGESGLLFDFPPAAPGSADDSGVRARSMLAATLDAVPDPGSPGASIEHVFFPLVASPRPAIPGEDPARYLRQWWIVEAARDTSLYIDIAAVPGPVAQRGGQDLSDDAEQHWEAAVRHDPSGAVLGPRRIGAGPRAQDVYQVGFSAGDIADFSAQVAGGDLCTLVLFDPRRARVSGAAFRSLPAATAIRARVRALNSAGAGPASPWSAEHVTGEAEQPLEISLPADRRRGALRIPWTTSVRLHGPGGPSAPARVSVAAPALSARRPDDVRVELGDLDAAGRFSGRTGPLPYILDSLEVEARAQSTAWARVAVRAATAAAAADLAGHQALRVQAVGNQAVSTIFVGLLDAARCGWGEEGASKGFRASLAAASMLKRAGRAKLLRGGVESTDPAGSPSRARPVGAGLPYSYLHRAPIWAHLQHRAAELGPVLLVDRRDWPDAPLSLYAPLARPLSYLEAARQCASALGTGWQLAQDGFLRPLLPERYPVRMLPITYGNSGLIARDVAPAAGPRDFGLLPHPLGAAPPAASARHRGASTAAGPGAWDHEAGAVVELGTYDAPWGGASARVHKLLILDPGGWGSRAPLPPLASPALLRIAVMRWTGEQGAQDEVTDLLIGADGAPLVEPPLPEGIVPPELLPHVRVVSQQVPLVRTWSVSPTHLIRQGWINDPPAAAEGAAGTAARSAGSGWRFAILAEVADLTRAPQEISWDSPYPLQLGRAVDFAGAPDAGGGALRVVRMSMRLRGGNPDDLRWSWRITAVQAAELAEAMDGYEFWFRRGAIQ